MEEDGDGIQELGLSYTLGEDPVAYSTDSTRRGVACCPLTTLSCGVPLSALARARSFALDIERPLLLADLTGGEAGGLNEFSSSSSSSSKEREVARCGCCCIVGTSSWVGVRPVCDEETVEAMGVGNMRLYEPPAIVEGVCARSEEPPRALD